ncbi:MAG: hypothetical protein ATN36_08885 [Epulopiscium sp. Nele67-Bin005]|nr:MAG: hypothetical protein ATN36_08885 [Epulopiscium sp. Nele67-Bin005]
MFNYTKKGSELEGFLLLINMMKNNIIISQEDSKIAKFLPVLSAISFIVLIALFSLHSRTNSYTASLEAKVEETQLQMEQAKIYNSEEENKISELEAEIYNLQQNLEKMNSMIWYYQPIIIPESMQ